MKKWSKSLSKLQLLIQNYNVVMSFLDSIENLRDLTLLEWNFRVLIRNNLLMYLKYKQIYWQKRYTIQWAKFGGENTKVFHAIATESFRRNYIPSLVDSSGEICTGHDEKV